MAPKGPLKNSLQQLIGRFSLARDGRKFPCCLSSYLLISSSICFRRRPFTFV